MNFCLKIHWAILTTLVVIVVTGVILDSSSSPSAVTLELRPNASIAVSVFRPFPDKLRLGLRFKDSMKQKRPELGKYQHNQDYEKKGYLEFAEPGEPIKLKVSREGKEVIYEAEPANSDTDRDLYPFVADGNPHRFPYPPNIALSQKIPAGNSTFNISVLEVGPKLIGEKATLIFIQPNSGKNMSMDPGYRFLGWFILWPLYALLLFVYFTVLAWKSSPRIGTEKTDGTEYIKKNKKENKRV